MNARENVLRVCVCRAVTRETPVRFDEQKEKETKHHAMIGVLARCSIRTAF